MPAVRKSDECIKVSNVNLHYIYVKSIWVYNQGAGSLVRQQETAGESVPLFAHTNVDQSAIWNRVDCGVFSNAVKLRI